MTDRDESMGRENTTAYDPPKIVELGSLMEMTQGTKAQRVPDNGNASV